MTVHSTHRPSTRTFLTIDPESSSRRELVVSSGRFYAPRKYLDRLLSLCSQSVIDNIAGVRCAEPTASEFGDTRRLDETAPQVCIVTRRPTVVDQDSGPQESATATAIEAFGR